MESLYDLRFTNQLLDVMKDSDINLIVEVTESRLMEDLIAPLDNLLRLRLKKIGLSIDDFGTGGANISQLRDLPFTELKLDLSFIQDASADIRSKSILHHTIELARQIGLTTVAEGIEEAREWEMVRAMGCDIGQGYYLSPPMPGNQVATWTQEWQREQERARCT
jgi:EAL domain-containing protein (putative c-di-GMP-specific phosphodiesterase class I)